MRKGNLLFILLLVFTMFIPYNVKQVSAIVYYYGSDWEKQLPGYPDPETFGSYPNRTPFILRVKYVTILLWPGTGKIEAQMKFDLYPRYGWAGILEQWFWADSYENEPVSDHTAQVFVTYSPPGLTDQLIETLSVYTGSIWDPNGYSADFTFYFQYIGGGGQTYKYCVFAVYLARSGSSYIALTSELGAFSTHQPHLYLTL